MTKTDEKQIRQGVFELLSQHGVPRNTRDYRDYEAAKRILLPAMCTEDDYRKTIRAIVEYCGV